MKLLQDLHFFSGSMDLCLFSAFAKGADKYVLQYLAMTGVPFTADGMLKAGERFHNLERYYNNLAGFGEGSDRLPDRFLKNHRLCPAPRDTFASCRKCWKSITQRVVSTYPSQMVPQGGQVFGLRGKIH